MGEVFGILSLKGGVGKTSSAISLGACLAEMGKKVLIVDCNYSAPNLGMHLKVVDPSTTIHHVLQNKAHITKAIHSLEKFDIVPASMFGEELKNPLSLRFHLDAIKRKYDFIILDSSPALNDETLSVIVASDKLLVLTTPDYPTLSMTIKAVSFAKRKGTPIAGLILNKVHNKNFELSLGDIEKTSEVPVLAVIPHDISFSKSLSSFTPYPVYKPSSKGTTEFKKLASTIAGEKYPSKNFRILLRKVLPKRQDINREIYYETVFRG